MGSNGPPPKDYLQVPTSPPAPLPRVKRDDVRSVKVSKSDDLNRLVTLAVLGGMLCSSNSESEDS
jgi:hypothetical protein